jgi:hypothetical protein
MTYKGGSKGYGVVFSFANNVTSVEGLSSEQLQVNVYPNPSNGKCNIRISNGHLLVNNRVEVCNIFGENIYSILTDGHLQYTIDIGSQPSGIYLYKVISEKNELIGFGKFVLSK